MSTRTLLCIGATGMLGRPVMRRLANDGRFRLRALVRNTQRAQALLPAGVEFVPGDLREPQSLAPALAGVDTLYVNLENSRALGEEYDPERDGLRVLLPLARAAGVRRIARISWLAAPAAANEWWIARRKLIADEEFMAAGIPYTIFRPTWFMESLPLLVRGRALLLPTTDPRPLYWLAGDDYARQVGEALDSPRGANRVYEMQGPEAVSFENAARRFAAAYPRHVAVLPLPRWLLAGMEPFAPSLRFLCELVAASLRHETRFCAGMTHRELGAPRMRIEDYVRYLLATGDLPAKSAA